MSSTSCGHSSALRIRVSIYSEKATCSGRFVSVYREKRLPPPALLVQIRKSCTWHYSRYIL